MKYLKVWADFENVLAPLQEDEIGRLFLAMLHYAGTGEEPDDFVGNETFLWPAAKQGIDHMSERDETYRANGLKGGRPKTKQNQTEPNETLGYEEEPNVTLKEKKIKEIKEKEKKKNENSPTGRGHFVPPTLEEVTAFCQERGNGINPQHFIDYYAARGWELKPGQKVKDWKACVRTWESREKAATVQKPIQSPASAAYQQRDLTGADADATRRMLEWLDGGDI